jgi:hypothetical protein
MDLGERAEKLAAGILRPLLLGGAVELQRPFGSKLAVELGVERTILDNELRAQIDDARLRVARSVVAVDVLPPVSAAEWSIAAGLNDLLQITNHELSTFASRGRHGELLESTVALCQLIGPCRNLQEAVARHATFSRALELSRTDTDVTWWTGSASFRGQEPPTRLLAWPELRKVRVSRTSSPLSEMAAGVPVAEAAFHDALRRWLSCSPLSDLASAARPAPSFQWSSPTVSLIATVAGGNLALRALSHATNDHPTAAEAALRALTDAAAALPEGAPRNIAGQFAGWLAEARSHWAEVG